jgi:hypothetical protein
MATSRNKLAKEVAEVMGNHGSGEYYVDDHGFRYVFFIGGDGKRYVAEITELEED